MGKLPAELKLAIDQSKLHIDKDICNTARYKLQKMIIRKIIAFFENKVTESISKPMEGL